MTLDELEQLAREATAGPWFVIEKARMYVSTENTFNGRGVASTGCYSDNTDGGQHSIDNEANAVHIAAWNPRTARAFVEFVRAWDAWRLASVTHGIISEEGAQQVDNMIAARRALEEVMNEQG